MNKETQEKQIIDRIYNEGVDAKKRSVHIVFNPNKDKMKRKYGQSFPIIKR